VERLRTGVVYTETIVHLAPARFAADVPYQVIIAKLDDGSSVTGRVNEEFVSIDDPVVEVETLDGVPYFVRSK
jgi:uncharacterized OB-fold protein